MISVVVPLFNEEHSLDALYHELLPLGPEPAVAQLDLERAQGPEYQALTEEIEKRYGRLDGLLHNASMLGERSPIEHYEIGLWQRVLLVNLTAPFILTRCMLPLLRQSADASLLFTTSGVGREGRLFRAEVASMEEVASPRVRFVGASCATRDGPDGAAPEPPIGPCHAGSSSAHASAALRYWSTSRASSMTW